MILIYLMLAIRASINVQMILVDASHLWLIGWMDTIAFGC